MKVARKMVLIPEEEYQSLLNAKPKLRDMKEILKGPRDQAAATKMSQLVGTYLRRRQPPLPAPKKDDILEYFEPIYQKKVTVFMSKLRDIGMDWNTNKELKLPSGEIINHSNIVDLIKEALVARKGKPDRLPLGWEDFIQAIANSSIPKSFFGKKNTLEEIERVSKHGIWEDY